MKRAGWWIGEGRGSGAGCLPKARRVRELSLDWSWLNTTAMVVYLSSVQVTVYDRRTKWSKTLGFVASLASETSVEWSARNGRRSSSLACIAVWTIVVGTTVVRTHGNRPAVGGRCPLLELPASTGLMSVLVFTIAAYPARGLGETR